MGEDFHVVDLVSQARAVQQAVSGMSLDAKLAWLGNRGRLEAMRDPPPGFQLLHRFESHAGIECWFFFSEDQIVFVGDHTTFTVDDLESPGPPSPDDSECSHEVALPPRWFSRVAKWFGAGR